MLKTTEEMMEKVLEMKRDGKDRVQFEMTENLGIFVEVVSFMGNDKLEIAIELRDIDTEDTKESAICNYDDDAEIESCIDYIRACI
jgi:hypothetical protein